MKQVLSIDIGGTSAKCARVWEDGRIEPLGSFATTSTLTGEELETALGRVWQQALEGGRPEGVGISTLGVVDKARGWVISGVENLPCLFGFPFREVFDRIAPGLPVRVQNDARSAALGEYWLGAAKGCESFVCVAFGTGVGGCVVLNGQPVDGAFHRAGEIGYWNYEGPAHYWEQTGSALALVRAAQEKTQDAQLDGVAFFDRLAAQDALCRELFDHWADQTGRVLANMVLLLDVERILVGGGISAQGEALTQPLQRAMERHLPLDFRSGCRVVPARLGNQAALLGAASPLFAKA